jgi:hypothetical protein
MRIGRQRWTNYIRGREDEMDTIRDDTSTTEEIDREGGRSRHTHPPSIDRRVERHTATDRRTDTHTNTDIREERREGDDTRTIRQTQHRTSRREYDRHKHTRIRHHDDVERTNGDGSGKGKYVQGRAKRIRSVDTGRCNRPHIVTRKTSADWRMDRSSDRARTRKKKKPPKRRRGIHERGDISTENMSEG